MIGDVLQPTHLIFILVVALLVLGPKRLPEVGKSLGRGIRDFRGALSGITDPEPTSPPEPPDVQVTPVSPATTTLPEDESVAGPSVALADQRVPAPTPPSDSFNASDQHTSALLPHVEPDEVQPVMPPADPSRQP